MKEGTILFHFLVTANFIKFPYPQIQRNEKTLVQVKDPYRWLEQDSYATKKFIKAQKKLTDEFFTSIPEREILRKSLTSIWNYKTFDCPTKKGNKYFFSENSGLKNQSVIFMQETLSSEPELVIDPHTFSDDGNVLLGEYTFSEDGETLAYVQAKGSGIEMIHFRNISSGVDFTKEILENTRSPDLAWTIDSSGVFYTKYPVEKDGTTALFNGKIYFHCLGTQQKDDILIAEFPNNSRWLISVEVSHCGGYLILSATDSYKTNAIFIASLETLLDETWTNASRHRGFQKDFLPIFPIDDADYTYVSNINSSFVFKTNKNATNSRIIMVEISDNIFGRKKNAVGEYTLQEIIPEKNDRILSWARLVAHETLILCYVGDTRNSLEMVDLKNTSTTTVFPLKPGTISDFKGGRKNDTEFFFLYESFLSPETVYKCDIATGDFDCEIHRQVSVKNINLDNFETKQVQYKSKDGTLISMNIISKKNPQPFSPTILYGFSGSEINSLPNFLITRLAFIEYFGGYYVHPSIRGGDENGDGSLLNVQNSIDDFIGAAEYLIKNNYTRPDSLTIQGSSYNGGMLIAAAVNARPQLFGSAIIDSGLMDMIRFQKFTVGYAWCQHFGCSDDQNEHHFKNLFSFSPLHNVKMPEEEGQQYPAILVLTADNDKLVAPLHSYKYIATLQNTVGLDERQKNPLLLRVETKGDHTEATLMTLIDSMTDVFSFLIESLGLDFQNQKAVQKKGKVQ